MQDHLNFFCINILIFLFEHSFLMIIASKMAQAMLLLLNYSFLRIHMMSTVCKVWIVRETNITSNNAHPWKGHDSDLRGECK